MYNQSADAKAEQHLMKWFALECSVYYEKVLSRELGKVVEERFEIFEGANFEEKLKQFNLFLEEIDEDDDQELTDRKKIIVEALPTINKVLSLWYKQLATDQETMEEALNEYFPKEKKEIIETEEEEEEKLPKKKAAKKKASSSKDKKE